MVYKFLEKTTRPGMNVTEKATQELHKPVIKKFKRKVYARFKDNFWAVDLAQIGSWSSLNCDVYYL